jgi:hypothetical protein
MASTLYMLPLTVIVQYLTNLGVIAAGATITTQVAGSVSTLQTTYTDSTGLVANPNPLTLNSSGRAAGSTGALIAFWVTAGTMVDVYFQDALGEIWSIKAMAGINDSTSPLAVFANPASGFGADLIANAVRSYDVIASVRAANVPVLTGPQTLVIDVEGGALVNDGNGGIFYWSSASTATDDGALVIKPTAILSANPGRYLRQTNLYGSTGSFTLTANVGFTTTPTMVCRYFKNGASVILSYNGITGTSNATTFSFTGFPSFLQGPTNTTNSALVAAEDNTANGVAAYWQIPSGAGGVVYLNINNASGIWTNSGTKGLVASCFSYTAT